MTTHLTDTQKQTIRIAMGTWAGWLDIKPNRRGQLCGKCPNTAPNVYSHLPDWTNSLDACHEVEVKLTDEEHWRFRGLLDKSTVAVRDVISASAEHRSLALYRALSLDKEAQP